MIRVNLIRNWVNVLLFKVFIPTKWFDLTDDYKNTGNSFERNNLWCLFPKSKGYPRTYCLVLKTFFSIEGSISSTNANN